MRAYSKFHRVRPPVDRSMIMFVARDLSESAAFAFEISLVAQHGRIDNETGCLRNRTNGGEGASGFIPSKKTRERMRLSSTGRKHVLGQTEKIATALRGKPRSSETKAKISASNRGRSISPETRARISCSLTGKHLSEETRKKLSATHKGVPWTAARAAHKQSSETIAKRAKSLTGHTVSEETRAKLAAQAGWKHSEEARHKMSLAAQGYVPWNKGARNIFCHLGHPLRSIKGRQDCPTCRAARKREKRNLDKVTD